MSCNNQQQCLLPWVHLYYHTDKNVYPCCQLANNPQFVVGKNTESVETLWNAPVLKDLRIKIKNKQEPKECYNLCYNNINPIHVHLPEEFKQLQDYYFQNTLQDGSFKENLSLWTINESNVCNFACIYCCSEFSNQFDKNTIKTFSSIEEQLSLFKKNVHNLKVLFLSSGETHLQSGYYEMLEWLIRENYTNIKIVAHTNMSNFKFGKRNLFELLSNFSDATVIGSLDSYEERAEYIRYGTKWKDILLTREELFKYPTIKFALQPVITNLNMWSLPDFHIDWFNRGYVQKDNIRYFTLDTPAELHISVLKEEMKSKITKKYQTYLEFLKSESSTKFNAMTPYEKINQILQTMQQPPKVNLGMFEYFVLKQTIKTKTNFLKTFPEFKLA